MGNARDMDAVLVIEPRTDALEYRPSTRTDAFLEGFFAFAAIRDFSTPAILADCAFFDVSISYYVRDWPGRKHHPGIFEEAFPTILERLIEPGKVLTLSVHDIGPGYFEPMQHVATQLEPRGLPYARLPSPGAKQFVGPSEHLVFQWPMDSLSYIFDEHWLHCGPFVQIEGYISSRPLLDLIKRLYSEPDTEQRIRAVLRATEFCFKTWQDGEGLFLLTDKLDLDALTSRLGIQTLNPMIKEAARR